MESKVLSDYLMGESIDAFRYFGAHFLNEGGREGVVFRLYAPYATDVSIIGEWNDWSCQKDKMRCVDISGVWELFIPGLENLSRYKFHFRNKDGVYVDKADPFAFYSELRPQSCSRLYQIDGFSWHDGAFLKTRTRNFDRPMSIYEVHLGSWKGKNGDNFLPYEEMADALIPYVIKMGYTHIELMPLTQYPFDGSWGYQATGFYSADSRYGEPKGLMTLVDRFHKAGLGVILDFAPVHFATDYYALREFDGSSLYEYADSANAFSQWGSCQFDLGKDPVRSFLMSAMNFFVTYFHIDGIRVDAVSNILYWNGDKSRGENFGAVEFVKRLNRKMHEAHPSLMMIAEDSTAFPNVTRPLEENGLGFDYKWDLGWMNDTLCYYKKDPIYKKWEHGKITFSFAYFFSENFLLPLSHDEVTHAKGTLLNKMFGDYDTKFALLRNLYAYQFAHPGKKLNFMGNELAPFDEWNEEISLEWNLLGFPKHEGIQRECRDLNLIYRSEPIMFKEEYNPAHFRWTLVDDKNQSVFAFERFFGDSVLLFIFNMTPVFYDKFDVPCYCDGHYDEIFNSDKDVYGGWNQYNGLACEASGNGPELKPFHVTIKLGSFAALILKRRVETKDVLSDNSLKKSKASSLSFSTKSRKKKE